MRTLPRAARLKDEFLANMSHELRTPLNAVLGLSEALLEQVSGPLNERQAKSLRVIHESGAHLLELINDILDLSKIEAGRVDLQLDAVPVEPLCRASLRLVKEAAYRKNLDVKLAVAPGVAAVRADERRLKQVLVNLLSNAVKFTRAGGALGLDVALNAASGAVEFAVWDTGIGMAEEDLGKLFQPFVQLDSGLARHHQGTGLGLALVRRLVELHGGSVSVTSDVGRGTRFTVAIPAGKAAPEPVSEKSRPGIPSAPATDATASSSTGPLVLLAEDNEANVLTLRDYLEARGYRLLVARDGAEAVALAQTHAPQLILMDVQMPDMDGFGATRRIRALPALRTTPIIALTALAMPGDRERCLAAGADDYLSKPVELRTLAARIAELLKR
ncbi:MAG: ATP-binding protein [Limisphaerales bacterium]